MCVFACLFAWFGVFFSSKAIYFMQRFQSEAEIKILIPNVCFRNNITFGGEKDRVGKNGKKEGISNYMGFYDVTNSDLLFFISPAC